VGQHLGLDFPKQTEGVNKMAKARILIVENESIIATDIQNTLKRLGYDAPAIAFSGQEAIKKTEQIKPRHTQKLSNTVC
jgi:PleD family two-component response regulator